MKKTLYAIVAMISIVSLAHARGQHKAPAVDPAVLAAGKALYLEHCARCHHADRIGISGPPLLPQFLRKYRSIPKLAAKIKDGFPQTLMPTFENLSESNRTAIAQFIKSPVNLKQYQWAKTEIKKSLQTYNHPKKDLHIQDMADVMPVVERDGGKVWIMEKEKILDTFELKNVHGGIKYRFPNADNIYVPTRDGVVAKYSLANGRLEATERMCVYLRNVSLSRDGTRGYTTCLLPEQMVVFDTDTLAPLEVKPLEGKISAIYDLYTKDQMVFTYRDKPKVGFVDTHTGRVSYRPIKEPIEDFFIDPFDRYLIATARHGKVLRVYDINTLRVVFEHEMTGMPHLFSATYWYHGGHFYFATPHLRSDYITVWEMYDWKFVKKVSIGGDGFFAKTHPATPYLWVDNGTDELVLVSKDDYSIKKRVPVKGKQYIHAEFSGDGKYTYLSIYEHNGSIEVWDTKTLKKITAYPADIPVGKYNFICKNRRFYPMLFGKDIARETFPDKNATEVFKDVLSSKGKLSEFEIRSLMDWVKIQTAGKK
jgi:mono/diheme cytochrome c family protein